MPGAGVASLLSDMDRAGIEVGILGGASNPTLARVAKAHPDRFISLAAMSPLDGMRGVRESSGSCARKGSEACGSWRSTT